MASYVNLVLDTTAPNIQLILPPYTTRTATTHVRVLTDDQLGTYQNFYFIDSEGTRHDVDMELSADKSEYNTDVVLWNLSIGIATFYAQVRDDVDNISQVVSKTIAVFKSDVLKVSIADVVAYRIPLVDGVTTKVIIKDEKPN